MTRFSWLIDGNIVGFYLLVTLSCVVWYSTITIYVSIRGAFDIKGMLARLAAKRDECHEAESTDKLP